MIIVCGLHDVDGQIALHGVQSVIGILSPDMAHPLCPTIAEDRRLRLSFNDIVEPISGLLMAGKGDVERLLAFLTVWDRRSPLLIHCWAGISRSTACAFAALCLMRPQEEEGALARELRLASPSATPNTHITSLVDQNLNRNGRMLAAIENIGRGANAFSGKPFLLNI